VIDYVFPVLLLREMRRELIDGRRRRASVRPLYTQVPLGQKTTGKERKKERTTMDNGIPATPETRDPD
jgi:hypothetical protein